MICSYHSHFFDHYKTYTKYERKVSTSISQAKRLQTMAANNQFKTSDRGRGPSTKQVSASENKTITHTSTVSSEESIVAHSGSDISQKETTQPTKSLEEGNGILSPDIKSIEVYWCF